jgi:DNA-binding XRE family transcriptional regulator
MPKNKKPASDAVEILHRRYYRGTPQRIAQLEKARSEDELARKIHQLREEAGLTQARLAKMIGTTESVISRLENSDYSGHSLKMLRRVADALGKRIENRFVPRERTNSTSPAPANATLLIENDLCTS